MLRRAGRPAARTRGEGGFTLIELTVVVAVMGVVLAIASGALISLSTAADRGHTVVRQEQLASTTLSALAHDIRSSHTLASVPVPAGWPAALDPDHIELEVNDPSGTCTSSAANPDYPPVQYDLVGWVYQPSARTLTRENLDCTTGAVVSRGWTLSGVANGATPVFTYYNQYGDDISTALTGAIAVCTTEAGVQLAVSESTSSVVKPFVKQEDVALTDQVSILSQPGNGQC